EQLLVKEFLDKCHLSQYIPVFMEEGFETLQAIMEITEEDLIAMNVKRGHRRVIQRGIATLKGVPKTQPLNFYGPLANNDIRSLSIQSPITTPPIQHVHSSPTAAGENEDNIDDDSNNNSNNNNNNNNNDDDSNYADDDNDVYGDSTTTTSSSHNHNILRRKYKRHPKLDKNAPIKPPSAYIMFSNDARSQLKDRHQLHTMSFVEIAKLVGDQWKNLSPDRKQAYERTAMRAKDEYIAALNEYRKTKEYKEYQKYLKKFKAEQDAMNRKIARMRKKAKERGSPGSDQREYPINLL
ncbi:high mobility group box domain-containing protein, partial [Mycotypha africana]|uniref:high mobility group box domain-containing protein n=1 Tax=Mycotypha africana TaxID=64632 RepID=UPI0023015966